MSPEPAGATKLGELRDRLDKDPKSRMFVQLAEEYRRAGQLGEAIAVLRRGLEHHPAYVAAWNLLGKLYLESGRDLDAKIVFERTLTMDPQNLVAARLLGDVHYRAGALVEAIKRYKLVRAISPGDDALDELILRIEEQIDGPRVPAPAPGVPDAAITPVGSIAAEVPAGGAEATASVPMEPFAPVSVEQAVPQVGSLSDAEVGASDGIAVSDSVTEIPATPGWEDASSGPEPAPPEVPELAPTEVAVEAPAATALPHGAEDLSPFEDSGTIPAPSGVTVPDPDSSDFWREEAVVPVDPPAPSRADPSPASAEPTEFGSSGEADDTDPGIDFGSPSDEELARVARQDFRGAKEKTLPQDVPSFGGAPVSSSAMPPAAAVVGEMTEGSLAVTDYRLRQGDLVGARASLEHMDASILPREIVADRWEQLARREGEVPAGSPFVSGSAGAVTDREAVIRTLRRWLDVIKKG